MGRSNGTGDQAVINFGSAASAQENTCTVRTFTVDARGKSVVTSSRTQPSNVRKVGKDSVLKDLWLVHFDPVTRKPQEDLKCVMPEGKAARQWISEYTSSRGRNGNSPLLSDAGVAVANSSFGVGTWCSTFGSPESGVTWMCEGIECAGSVQLRAPHGRTKHRGGRTAAVSGGGFGGTFYCTGAGEGCFLSVTDYGDGTAEIYFGGSCAAEGGGDGGSGGGSGGSGTPPGEGIDSTLAPANPFAFCPIEMQPDPPLDQQPPSPPIETCSSESCMRNSPGVWVGSIALTVQVFSNFRHTAIAVVRLDNSVRVTELMGWTESASNVIRTGVTPYMDGFEGYSWVKVGDAGQVGRAEASVANATNSYQGGLYTLSSNRFTSAVLRGAGLTLRQKARVHLGDTPGICSCNACSPFTP